MAEYYHFDEDGREAPGGPEGWEPPAGPWERVPTAPDLLVFRRPDARGGADGPRAVLAGDLAGFQVVELLGYLAQSRWTGALTLHAGGQERRLGIRRGRLVRAESNAPAHRLGQVLRALGLVERDVLDRELEPLPGDPERLGARLVADGMLTEEGLASAIQRRLEEIFYDLLDRQEGLFFLFNETLEVDEDDPELDLNFLLMEGLRRIDETRRFREVIPHEAVWVVPSGDGMPEEPSVRALLQAVGDGIEWARLQEELGLFEFDLAEQVVAAVQDGLLEVREDPPPPGGATGAAWETARRMNAVLAEVFEALPSEARPEVADAVDWFLSDGDHGQEAVLAGLALQDDGSLPAGDLVANLEAVEEGAEDALEALTFFLLMQAGRHLGTKANQRLSRRVQAALKGPAATGPPAAEPDPFPEAAEAAEDEGADEALIQAAFEERIRSVEDPGPPEPEEAPPSRERGAWRWPEPGDLRPPRPSGGVLEVESEPAGAWVYLDGRRLGRTPLSHLKPEEAGAHKLEVRLSGWKIWSRTVMLPAEGSSRFEVQLHPAQAPARP